MKHYLTACAMYLDEAFYLREWIAFHRLVGVEQFYLYDNENTDEHREMLAPYIEQGVVVMYEWPIKPGQIPAYHHCLAKHGADSRWIAFLDLDEFLFSPTYRPVPEILADYEEFPAVAVNWAMFGSSGHRTRPPGLALEATTTARTIRRIPSSTSSASSTRAARSAARALTRSTSPRGGRSTRSAGP